MALFLLTMTALTTGAPEMATTALPLLAPALATPPLLAPRAFVPVRLGVTMPSGWMRSQLQAQDAGLCGNGYLGGGTHANKSAWVGGPGANGLAESWVYWANGAIPLATLLGDDASITQAKLKKSVDFILAAQEKNGGWLGPLVNGSPWSSFRGATCLNQWAEATGDARVQPALFQYAASLLAFLKKTPLKKNSWAQMRWQEGAAALEWLLDHPGPAATDAQKATVTELIALLAKQGMQWASWVESTEDKPFTSWPGVPKPAPAGFSPWFPNNTADADSIGTNKWQPGMDRMWTHGVNLGQAMNVWGVMYRSTKDKAWIQRGKAGWDKIMQYHGQATGVMTGDETLSGLPPDRGTETCTVVETLNSASEMFLTTGDTDYADRAERIAYNSLPGAFMNGTMWSLNYFQQVNKLDAIDGCEKGCTYCFGMVYECCVGNHAQGWPKFAARQLATAAADGGLALVYFFDAESKAVKLSSGQTVSVTVSTAYPFGDGTVNIALAGATKPFPLYVRVPAWAAGASITVGGKKTSNLAPGSMAKVAVPAGATKVVLSLPLEVRVERRPPYILTRSLNAPANAANIFRGPVMFGLPRDFTLDHAPPYDDSPTRLPVGQAHGQNNYLLGTGNWTYALQIKDDKNPGADLVYAAQSVPAPPKGQGVFSPFLSPGVIHAKASLLPKALWDSVKSGRGADATCPKGTSIHDYVCKWASPPPKSPVAAPGGAMQSVVLLPYGATDLRIGEFPTTN